MPIEQIITLLSSLSILATPTTLPVSGYTLTEVRLVYPPSEDNPKGFEQKVIIKYYEDTKPQIKEEAKIEKVEEVKAKVPEAPAISSDYYSQMKYWCNFYGCNPDTLYRVMMCESGGNPKAMNGIHTSIFQYNPNTFRHYSVKAGITNSNIWNTSHQIQTTAYMFSTGEARQWSCK